MLRTRGSRVFARLHFACIATDICRNVRVEMPYGRHRLISFSYRLFHARDYTLCVDTKNGARDGRNSVLRRLDILSIPMSSVTGLLR